ncbi:spermatogenesis associated 6-like protein isoform X2 [Vanessa tameamea]|uniref:Spermatogenesis associated 6-like protein isoform X2 n=1 Tax=Vanessa tameamea TaxID=334116 RepID=A0ABM4AIL8_VANTA
MPKLIELTIEIEVQKVSCPGVWLCQDGRVSLTVFALGTSYHTCLLPPVFPLSFKDIFYFRKRFQESCALNNICCLLKGETIYCELVQWCDDCSADDCVILAQYLGALNDVLFPPNMCSADGVDLLMRRSKDFPGILSPKIEIATKVRIDEIWNQHDNMFNKSKPCHCNPLTDVEKTRQKQVCHSAQYHRTKCNKTRRSRSRSRSDGSRSCCSLDPRDTVTSLCRCPKISEREIETSETANDERLQKLILESRFIEQENVNSHVTPNHNKQYTKVTPCVCEICKRYHELFHSNTDRF